MSAPAAIGANGAQSPPMTERRARLIVEEFVKVVGQKWLDGLGCGFIPAHKFSEGAHKFVQRAIFNKRWTREERHRIGGSVLGVDSDDLVERIWAMDRKQMEEEGWVFDESERFRDMIRGTENYCSSCGANSLPGTKLKVCAKCRCAWYCEKKCQVTDWKRHKECCKPLANLGLTWTDEKCGTTTDFFKDVEGWPEDRRNELRRRWHDWTYH